MPPDTNAEQTARKFLAANPFPPTPWVTVTDAGIVIATGYSEALNRLLRWVPGAKWRPGARSWMIPLSGAEAVRAVLPEITRLADAAQELDASGPSEPAPTPESETAGAPDNDSLDPLVYFAKAAELLHGPDWRGILANEPSDPSVLEWITGKRSPDPAGAGARNLIAGLRRKAETLAQAADRLEASLRFAALGQPPSSQSPRPQSP